jgi:hypothetical protein
MFLTDGLREVFVGGSSISTSARSWITLPTIAAVALLCAGTPARAGSLTINPIFDSSITGDASSAAIEGAISGAIAEIESAITSPNNLTVNILYQETNSGLGGSSTFIGDISYFSYYNALKAVATSPEQLAAVASLGPAPVNSSSPNPVNGSTLVELTTAEFRNLGFVANPPGGQPDSTISLNTSITSPPNSLSGNYGLESVAAHETDEALGIGGTGSTLSGTGTLTGAVGDLDLYRYDAAGVRSYSNADPLQPYFSIDGGNTVVSYFNQVAGADFADWESDPIPAGFGPQVQDAFGEPGTNPQLGPNEILAYESIGYDVVASATPEPSSLLLGGLGLALGCSFLRRRRTAA